MILIYDKFGNPQSWDWLRQEFGELVVWPADSGPGWRVVELRENDDVPLEFARKGWEVHAKEKDGTVLAPAVIIVKVLNGFGLPVPI